MWPLNRHATVEAKLIARTSGDMMVSCAKDTAEGNADHEGTQSITSDVANFVAALLEVGNERCVSPRGLSVRPICNGGV